MAARHENKPPVSSRNVGSRQQYESQCLLELHSNGYRALLVLSLRSPTRLLPIHGRCRSKNNGPTCIRISDRKNIFLSFERHQRHGQASLVRPVGRVLYTPSHSDNSTPVADRRMVDPAGTLSWCQTAPSIVRTRTQSACSAPLKPT